MGTIQSRDKDKAGWDSSILDYFLPGSSSFTPLQVERVKEQPAGGVGGEACGACLSWGSAGSMASVFTITHSALVRPCMNHGDK